MRKFATACIAAAVLMLSAAPIFVACRSTGTAAPVASSEETAWGPELIPPAWDGVEAPAPRTAGFLFPRPVPPLAPDKVVRKAGTDGMYVKGSDTKWSLERTLIEVVGFGRAAFIQDIGSTHENMVVRDVSMRALDCPDSAYQNWLERNYGMRGDCLHERVAYGHDDGVDGTARVTGAIKEHDFYGELEEGTATFRDCLWENAGAQGFQLRLTGNAADPAWPLPKHLIIDRCAAIECGLARGIGRAGFAVSIKTLGPAGIAEIDGLVVQTVNQKAVKVYNGRTYDSFGAICVEFCDTLVITDSLIAMANPDRDAVQLFDFGNKNPTGTGPRHVLMKNDTLRRGNTIAVREGDGEDIEIVGCTGAGYVRVFVYRGKNWVFDHQVPIEQGYSWHK